MRQVASVLHLDLDAFFAAVEQRDKPSLRGKPVVVGGVGGRGVVSTASYEARKYGVRSAMSTREARSRCPHAAFLSGRFHAYRTASERVMAVLRETSPLVEPLSLDEAFVDLAAARTRRPRDPHRHRPRRATARAGRRGDRRPDGVRRGRHVEVHRQGRQRARQARRPGRRTTGHRDGPAAPDARLGDPGRRAGHHRAAAAGRHPHGGRPGERQRGRARPPARHRPRPLASTTSAHARDDRPVVAERETKSVSVEGTYDTDLTDRKLMAALLTRQARSVSDRLRAGGLAGRTVTIKVRLHDFTTLNRSTTIGSPTDAPTTIGRLAVALLQDLDTTGGVRLLGVGVSGLADWIQEDLFGETVDDEVEAASDLDLDAPSTAGAKTTTHTWAPGMDVEHAVMGRGWVWGSGRGVVTVRFETAETEPGSGAQLPDRRTRPQTMATGAGRRGYSPGHARTTSLTTPRPRSPSAWWRTPRCASSSRSSRCTPCCSPTRGCRPARSRRCSSSGRRPTCCSRYLPAPGPTPCRGAACWSWAPRCTPAASRSGRPCRRTPPSPAGSCSGASAGRWSRGPTRPTSTTTSTPARRPASYRRVIAAGETSRPGPQPAWRPRPPPRSWRCGGSSAPAGRACRCARARPRWR